MKSAQLIAWAGLATAIGGALAGAGGLMPKGPVEVIVVAIGAAFAAIGQSIMSAESPPPSTPK